MKTLNPKKLAKYKLHKIIKKEGTFEEFSLAIYTKDNQKFLKKSWLGKSKLAYWRLKNEIKMYKLFDENKVTQDNFILIPKFHGSFNKNKTLLIEFIKGNSLSDKDPQTQIKVYKQATEYIAKFGNSLSRDQKLKIGTRSGFVELIMYPFLLIRTLTNYPKFTSLFLRVSLEFIKLIPLLLKNYKLVLTHRDLHLKNILVRGEKAWIIDLENMVFTLPEYEQAVTLISAWRNKEFFSSIFSNLKNKKLVKAFIIKLTIHYLTEANLEEEKLSRYTQILSWTLNEKSFSISNSFHLPLSIRQWTLVKKISTKEFPYIVGLYKNGKQKVAIKMWLGPKNSLHAECLRRETSVVKNLHEAGKKFQTTVSTPNFVESIENYQGIFLVTKYISGIKLSKLNILEQEVGYQEVRNYFKQISKSLTQMPNLKIRQLPKTYFLILGPILFL